MKGRKLRTRTHRSIIAFRPIVRHTSRLSPRICRLAHVSSSYPYACIVCVYVRCTHVENRVSVDGWVHTRTDSMPNWFRSPSSRTNYYLRVHFDMIIRQRGIYMMYKFSIRSKTLVFQTILIMRLSKRIAIKNYMGER